MFASPLSAFFNYTAAIELLRSLFNWPIFPEIIYVRPPAKIVQRRTKGITRAEVLLQAGYSYCRSTNGARALKGVSVAVVSA